jgi:endonuclease YncB( thermonuclease family)
MLKRTNVVIFAFTFLLLLHACEFFTFSETYEGKVIKVLDGDSINISHHGKELRIRLAEIDAPENGQPYWKKSKHALENYVAGKLVVVEEFDRDQYGRIVGHVYLGDNWINGELVQQGYAYVYTRYAVSKKLYELENDAQKNQRGIWNLPENERIKPWKWRENN